MFCFKPCIHGGYFQDSDVNIRLNLRESAKRACAFRMNSRPNYEPEANCSSRHVEVVKDLRAGGLGFYSRAGQIGHCLHRCEVSVCPGAKLRRQAPLLPMRFGVICVYNKDLIWFLSQRLHWLIELLSKDPLAV